MRDIKFRIWIKDREQMIYLEPTKQHYDFENGFVYGFADEGYPDFNAHEKYSDEEDFEVMQYTGLDDKNGKEIYEGDILQSLGVKVKVFFNESTASFDMEHEGGDCEPFVPQYGEWEDQHHEVIGNIYMNPDLV